MNTTKIMIGAGVAAVLLAGFASLALADLVITPVSLEGKLMTKDRVVGKSNAEQMVLQVSPKGEVLLRGTISAVGSATLTVKSWGGDWTVNVASSAQLLPESATLAQFQVGDFVGAQGMVNQSAAWTVDAKLVRNWTAKAVVKENRELVKKERRNNEQEIRDVIKNESPKNWEGVASNINVDAKSFTLTMGGVAYTVNLVADAKMVDQKFLSASFAEVKSGDTVRVWGPVAGTTISAYVSRDVSLMAK